MQNRLYFQRTKQALNKGKALSDEEVLGLLKNDQVIRSVYGALEDSDLGYPGAAEVFAEPDTYQQFLQEYMNDVIPMIADDGQIIEVPKPGLENKRYYY
jgi:hypothetical protein